MSCDWLSAPWHFLFFVHQFSHVHRMLRCGCLQKGWKFGNNSTQRWIYDSLPPTMHPRDNTSRTANNYSFCSFLNQHSALLLRHETCQCDFWIQPMGAHKRNDEWMFRVMMWSRPAELPTFIYQDWVRSHKATHWQPPRALYDNYKVQPPTNYVWLYTRPWMWTKMWPICMSDTANAGAWIIEQTTPGFVRHYPMRKDG